MSEYALKQMYVAVRALATGSGDLRYRLRDAWHICQSVKADAQDFPTDSLRARWATWRDELGSRPAEGDEGTVRSTIDQASDEDIHRWAGEFVDIAFALVEASGTDRQRRDLVV